MKKESIRSISVVLPIYNEAGNIQPLYRELCSVLDELKKPYELIFVNDCSSDNSLDILETLFETDKNIQVVSLLGNQGQTSALNAGFKKASGDVVIAMDGDGQHDPKYIPEFISSIEEGFDVASSWKKKDSQRNILSSFISTTAHVLIGKLVGVKMKYFGATMKAYRKDILTNLELTGDLHRFAGALIYYKGIKIREIPIEIRPRKSGTSSYKFSKIFKVILDLILIRFLMNYARTPFRIFGTIGIFSGTIGFAGLSYIAFRKYAFGIPAFEDTALVVVSSMGLIVGVQLILFGLISELISRIYYTNNNKEAQLVRTHLKR